MVIIYTVLFSQNRLFAVLPNHKNMHNLISCLIASLVSNLNNMFHFNQFCRNSQNRRNNSERNFDGNLEYTFSSSYR
jgi:hypothetical protein